MQPRFAIFAALAALAVATVSADQRGGRERGIIVSASLTTGAPVTDLTATDFVVREDNLVREVIRVGPAPPPSHIVLLADDSDSMQFGIPFLRSGLSAFIRKAGAMKPVPQLSLMTFGERPTRRAPFAETNKAVEQAVTRIFPVAGAGAYFLQAVVETCQDLRKRNAPSPVIVAFVSEKSPEFSNDSRKQVAAALEFAGASLWIVSLQGTSSTDRSPEAYERAVVLGDVTVFSGGMTRTILSMQAIEPGFDGLATLIAARYLVMYGRPDQTIPPTTIDVTTKRPDVRVLHPHWLK